ncbi:hypothetical protein D9M71_379800 [compost metagenome]
MLPGIVGFNRLAIAVEQAPVKVEAVGLVPARCAERTGKTPADRACGVDADQIQFPGALLDLHQHLVNLGQRLVLHVMALPGAVVELQVRVGFKQWQGLTQLPDSLGQALLIDVGVIAEGELQLSLAPILDQLEDATGLLHLAGLAHFGMVEANELRVFGAVAQGEMFGGANLLLQAGDQALEALQWGGSHQASPPNTSIWLNTQAGEACPTRTTWFGSPLPQFGVPRTCKVLASPTALRLPQNCAEIPR